MFRDLIEDLDNYSNHPETFLDVPFVPTDVKVVEAMLNLAQVGPKDVLYDLGSGDGRIVVAAARDRNARAIGVELDPLRVADAMEYAGWSRVEHLVDFIEEDLFDVDLREATVVTMYLLHSINVQLRPKLLSQLRPGARVISHAFDMGDWKPDHYVRIEHSKLYKWVVPARVAGPWEWEGAAGEPYLIELEQEFQEVTGRAWIAGKRVVLKEAVVAGPRLELQLVPGNTEEMETWILDFTDDEDEPTVTLKEP